MTREEIRELIEDAIEKTLDQLRLQHGAAEGAITDAILSALAANKLLVVEDGAINRPDVWSDEERDALAAAFARADAKHGHYETLFAVGAEAIRLLRKRLDLSSLPPPETEEDKT